MLKNSCWRFVSAGWLLLCLAVLGLSLGGGDHPRRGEADIVLVTGMGILGFPATAAVALAEAEAMRRLYECCGMTYLRGDAVRIVRWVVYFCVATAQWFYVLPRLIRWAARRRPPERRPAAGALGGRLRPRPARTPSRFPLIQMETSAPTARRRIPGMRRIDSSPSSKAAQL